MFEYFYNKGFFCDLDERSILEIYIELFNNNDQKIVIFLFERGHLNLLVNFAEQLIFHESFEKSLQLCCEDEESQNFNRFENILSMSILVFQLDFLENPARSEISNMIRVCEYSKILGNLELSVAFYKETVETIKINSPDDNKVINGLFEAIKNLEAEIEQQKTSRSLPDDLLMRLGILDEVSDLLKRDASMNERRSIAAKILENLKESLQYNSVEEGSSSDESIEKGPNI